MNYPGYSSGRGEVLVIARTDVAVGVGVPAMDAGGKAVKVLRQH